MENSTLVQLQRMKTNTPQGFYVSRDFAQRLKVRHRQPIHLALGKHAVKTQVFIFKRAPDKKIWVTPGLWSRLHIPHGGPIHIKRESGGVRIGPLIGIMTTGVRNDLRHPVGTRSNFFRHLLSAQANQGVFYFVFAPESTSIKTQTIRGLFLQPRPHANGYTWARIQVPFPDVVYDRIPNRMNEKRLSVQSIKKYMIDQKSVVHFNPGFFNKWEIHQLLAHHPEVSRYIPETYHSPSAKTLEVMLKKHKMVYLKPAGGSLGLGILKITAQPQHGYFCRYNVRGRNVLKRSRSLSQLFRHIGGHRRLSHYLIQQGVQLMKYKDRPLDFRIHLHKNHNNEWEVIGGAAKLAGRGSVTTHVRTGGSVLSSSEAIRHYFRERGKEIEKNINIASIQLARAIEQSIGKPLGEIGFDIGVDQNGSIWMFEANSKPGRHVFHHPSLRYLDRISIQRILDYSKYLAHF